MARKIMKKTYLTVQQERLLANLCGLLGVSEAECLRMGLWELAKTVDRLMIAHGSGGTALIMKGLVLKPLAQPNPCRNTHSNNTTRISLSCSQ